MPAFALMLAMRRVRPVLVTGCAMLVVSCGRPTRTEAPKVISVQGKVTYSGKPVPGAVVTFLHSRDHEKSAFAIADGQGSYSSMTNDFAGMFPGEYRVTVTKPDGVPRLPAKYKVADTSPLQLIVKPDEPQQYHLTLED
jgi:hypothetical protein